MCSRKKISALQTKRISKCVWELTTETFDTNNADFVKPFSVFEMKVTQYQNNYFLSGAIITSSHVCIEKYSSFCQTLIITSVSFGMRLVHFNIQKHGINGYLRKGQQILCFGPAVN